MENANKLPTGLVGAAGEYFVAAELSQRGWLATVTIKNAKATDVLAQRLEPPPPRILSVQTKTTSPGNENFTLSARDESVAIHEDQWFVFVGLSRPGLRPNFWIVPHDVVAARIYSSHRHWLGTPSPTGKDRNDTPRRAIHRGHLDGYQEAWELLDSKARDAPFVGHAWILDVADAWGLPPGHPWSAEMPIRDRAIP